MVCSLPYSYLINIFRVHVHITFLTQFQEQTWYQKTVLVHSQAKQQYGNFVSTKLYFY